MRRLKPHLPYIILPISYIIFVFSDCVHYAGGPSVILPVNNSLVEAPPSGNVSLVCEGFYGPGYRHRQTALIGWYKADSQKPLSMNMHHLAAQHGAINDMDRYSSELRYIATDSHCQQYQYKMSK